MKKILFILLLIPLSLFSQVNLDNNSIKFNEGRSTFVFSDSLQTFDNRVIYEMIKSKNIINTTNETTFFNDTNAIGTRTFPANTLRNGDVIRLTTRSIFNSTGMNYRKKGLIRLIKLICSNQVERLVISHKDRLLRFGSDLIFMLCEHFGTEVTIINKSSESTFEEDLSNDIIEIITVFSARLYGSRSHKNKKIIEQLKDVAKELR